MTELQDPLKTGLWARVESKHSPPMVGWLRLIEVEGRALYELRNDLTGLHHFMNVHDLVRLVDLKGEEGVGVEG